MLLKLIRYSNWWFYKIPPLLSIGYVILLINQVSLNDSWAILLGVLIALISVASYGHIINDVFDIREDQRAGKPNAFAGISLKATIVLVTMFILIGFMPPLILKFNKVSVFILLINYLLPTAYSIPPARLKERGIWGLLFDAAGAHAIPTVFVGITMTTLAIEIERSYLWLISAACWASVYGLRGIIIHQIRDSENDIIAGVGTYGAKSDISRLRTFLNRVVLPCEIIFLLIMTGFLATYNSVIFIATVLYVFLEVVRHIVNSKKTLPPYTAKRENYIFRGDYYEVWLPVILIMSLAVFDKSYLFLLVFHIVLFFKRYKIHVLEIFKGLSFLFGAPFARWGGGK